MPLSFLNYLNKGDNNMQIIITENDLINIANSCNSLKQMVNTLEKCISAERFSGQMDDQAFTDESIHSIKHDLNLIDENLKKIKELNLV